jgi:hypothetical protein
VGAHYHRSPQSPAALAGPLSNISIFDQRDRCGTTIRRTGLPKPQAFTHFGFLLSSWPMVRSACHSACKTLLAAAKFRVSLQCAPSVDAQIKLQQAPSLWSVAHARPSRPVLLLRQGSCL